MSSREILVWVVVGALLLFGGIELLKRQVVRHNSLETAERLNDEEQTYDEDFVRQRVAASKKSEISLLEPIATPRATTRIVRLTSAERGEGFEAEKLRTYGDSSIYGIVRGADRKPLAGVTVQLFDPDPMTSNPALREAVTDTSGTYTLERVNAADRLYLLVARAENYAPYADFVFLRGVPLERNIQLEEGVECSGKVVDAVTSLPLPQATVYHPWTGSIPLRALGTVQTSGMGEFRFLTAPRGRVSLLAQCPGYCTARVVTQTPTNTLTIALMPGGAVIRGVTISRLTQKPEGGSKVIAFGENFITSAMTDDKGNFEFQNMPAGNYTLVGIKGMAGIPEKVTLRDREVKEGAELIIPAPLFVSGKVIHALSSKPLPGVKIYYSSPSGKSSVTSDESGLFAFETMAVDEYSLEVHEKGFLPLLEKKTTGSVEKITQKIRRSDASDQIVIRLRPVPCIEGTVYKVGRDGKRGAPVAAIDVPVAYQQRSLQEVVVTRSDALGHFFVNLPSGRRGTAKIVVPRGSTLGFASTRIPVRKPLEILLKPDRMNGELYLSDGTPLAGVEIRSQYLFPDNAKPEEARRLDGGSTFVRNSGRFSLPLAPHQKVELVFILPDGTTSTKSFNTDELLRRQYTFVYDPLAKDVIFSERSRGTR